MTTKLAIYNKALTEHLGERKLASLAENREPRRVLDDIWDGGGTGSFVDKVLAKGQWKFAKRTSKLTYNPAVTPAFGHPYVFDKPTDFIRLVSMCSDEFQRNPLVSYEEEAGQWLASIQDIYVSYVSNDASYGNDFTAWPEAFAEYVAIYLAYLASSRIGLSRTDRDALKGDVQKALVEAQSKDALEGPTRFLPPGLWVRSRGGQSGEGPRNRGTLLG